MTGSGDNQKDMMVLCEFKEEIHVFIVNKDTKVIDIYGGLSRKWSEITIMAKLWYEIPGKTRFVQIYFDEDIVEMVRLHTLLKAEICKMVATTETPPIVSDRCVYMFMNVRVFV